MSMGTLRPGVLTALLVAGTVATVGIMHVGDATEVVAICNAVAMAVLGLGNKIVESDMDSPTQGHDGMDG